VFDYILLIFVIAVRIAWELSSQENWIYSILSFVFMFYFCTLFVHFTEQH